MPKLVIETELDTKQFDKQILKIQNDIKELEYEYEGIKKVKPFEGQDKMLADYQAKIERAKNSIIRLKEEQQKMSQQSLQTSLGRISNIGYNFSPKLASGFSLSQSGLSGKALGDLQQKTEWVADSTKDLKNAFAETGEQGERAANETSDAFSRGVSSLKRFALGLFGIQGMFSLLRKGVSSYLSEHEETAAKINSIWTALGNALGPIIETIANMVLKLIGYLNVFLQALGFNVDLTKGMGKSKKAIEDTTGAMKKLNNQVASFDEMNIAQKQTSSGGIGGSGADGTSGFEMPELNSKVVKLLQDLGKEIKDNIWLIGLLAGAFATFKVAEFLSKLGSVIGKASGTAGTGLLGLHNLLTGILAMEVIILTIYLIYHGMQINELRELNDEIERNYKLNTKDAKEVSDQNYETAKTYEVGDQALTDYVNSQIDLIRSSREDIQAMKDRNKHLEIGQMVINGLTGETKKQNIVTKEATERMANAAANLQKLAKEGKLTEGQMQVYNSTMEYLRDVQKDVNAGTKIAKSSFEQLPKPIQDTDNALTNQIDSLIKNDDQMRITTNNEKNYWNDLTDTIFGNIRKIDGASATVTINADTTPIESAFHKIANTPGITDFIASNIINTFRFIKFAKGGIVYNPGRGVPIAGEATGGPEGVVPLNNEQSMDLIGQSIAKHLVVNLTNTTTLDGKVIAREQRKLETENNFATNGRGV